MEKYIEIEKKDLQEYLSDYEVICCKIRNSRIKAKQLSILEIIMLMYDKKIFYLKNGPLGDVKGIISFMVHKTNFESFIERLKFVGYCNKFYKLSFYLPQNTNQTDIISVNKLFWKGLEFSVFDLFQQDEQIYEEQSPHNRKFKIVSYDGSIKALEGYRGDGSELGRRALPVEDARCLVNLSLPFRNKNIIDPFAGGGGVIFMYRYINPAANMSSIDIDPILKPGLEYFGSTHYIGNAGKTELRGSFDALVTEVPFSDNATSTIKDALKNIYNVLNEEAMIVLMCGKNQNDEISDCLSNELKSGQIFTTELNRKGTDVSIQVWTKGKILINNLDSFSRILKKVY